MSKLKNNVKPPSKGTTGSSELKKTAAGRFIQRAFLTLADFLFFITERFAITNNFTGIYTGVNKNYKSYKKLSRYRKFLIWISESFLIAPGNCYDFCNRAGKSGRNLVAARLSNIQFRNYSFMMMSGPAEPKYIVVSKLPPNPIGMTARMLVIFNKTTLSTWVSILPALMLTWQDNLGDVRTAQSFVRRDGVGPRDSALDTSQENINSLIFEVQTVVNGNKSDAQAIVDSCGLYLKGAGGPHETVFHGEYGLTGQILLFAAGIEEPGFHQWYYSSNGVDYVLMQSTVHNNTSKDDLTPGQYAWFMHQIVLGDGPEDIETDRKSVV